ncbi:hypothetical protein CYY_003826 [Polysphondylium violaceum]|uniref:Ankyrin repeat-containing protein n=1 Tax=Polysphondylium violaceum TaxID=133409 RepID=A0A8J4PWE3_9MYCE|nr:hypothetical protein CYY_003826 [Polysphondylium violaceum]
MKDRHALLREVFNHKFIKTLIFSFIERDNAQIKAYKYDDVVSLDWMVQNKQWALLRYKMNRLEYIHFDMGKSRELIFGIRDLDLFVKVYNRFKEFFVAFGRGVEYAARANNTRIVKYLVEKMPDNYERALEQCTLNKNLDLVRYIMDKSEKKKILKMPGIITTNLRTAIENKDVVMIKYLSQFNEAKQTEEYKVILLKIATATGSTEIFELVYRLYKAGVSEQWLLPSVPHYDLFVYLVVNFYKYIGEDLFFKLARATVQTRSYKSLLFLKQSNHLTPQIYKFVSNLMAVEAFREQDIDAYNMFANGVPCKMNTLSISSIKDALSNPARVKEFLKMGTSVTSYCFQKASSDPSTWETFMYLWECSKKEKMPLTTFISRKSTSITNRHIFLLEFLIEQDYNLQNEHWFWSVLAHNDENFAFINKFLSVYTISFPSKKDVLVGLSNAARYGAVANFKLIYNHLHQAGFINSNDIIQAYTNAIFYSHYDIVQFLVNSNAPHLNTMLGKCRTVGMAKLLLESGHSFTSYTIRDAVIGANISVLEFLLSALLDIPASASTYPMLEALKVSVQQNRVNHFKLLLAHYNGIKVGELVQEIGEHGNVDILKEFHNKCPSDLRSFASECLSKCIQNGHLFMMKYLISHFNRSLLNALDFESVLHYKYYHILEYFREPLMDYHSNISKLFNQAYLKEKDSIKIDGKFSHFIQKFIYNSQKKNNSPFFKKHMFD